MGCHCLLQCVKVKSESDVAQSCPTLSNPMDCSLLVSMNSLGKNTGVGCYSPENLPDPGIKPRSPMMQAGSLLSEPARKPIFMVSYLIFLRKIDPLIKIPVQNDSPHQGVQASLMGKIFLSLLSIYGTLFLHSYCNRMPYIIVKYLSCLLNFVITLEENHVIYFCFFTPV